MVFVKKFDWRELALDIASAIDEMLLFMMGVVLGMWAITISPEPDLLPLLQQQGDDVAVTMIAISFGFSLLNLGLKNWLGQKEEAQSEPV